MSALRSGSLKGHLDDRPLIIAGEHGVRPYTRSYACIRIAWLYLVSRRWAHTLVAFVGIAVAVWWVMDRTPDAAMGMDVEDLRARNQTLFVHLAAMMLASAIGVSLWSPFGEAERVSPRMLPVLRALHVLGMLAVGLVGVALVIARWDAVIPGVDLVALVARNTLFLTGCLLLAGRVLDVRLAWLVPVLLGGVTVIGLMQVMRRMERIEELWQASGWNILAQDQTRWLANLVCLTVGLVALALYVRDGVRDSDEAE